MATWEEAIKSAYASCPSDLVYIDTLTLEHVNFAGPIYLVDQLKDMELGLETGGTATFRACSFRISLPKVSDEGYTSMDIAMDNTSREILQTLRLVRGSNSRIKVTYRPYISTDTSTPQMDPPLELSLSDISINAKEITAKADFRDLINRKHPYVLYTRARFPGLVTI
jgi:hypothetical protein